MFTLRFPNNSDAGTRHFDNAAEAREYGRASGFEYVVEPVLDADAREAAEAAAIATAVQVNIAFANGDVDDNSVALSDGDSITLSLPSSGAKYHVVIVDGCLDLVRVR